MRVLKVCLDPCRQPPNVASRDIRPMRVLKEHDADPELLKQRRFTRHSPDEGTESVILIVLHAIAQCFTRHSPDEGTESEGWLIMLAPLIASRDIRPMRVLKG